MLRSYAGIRAGSGSAHGSRSKGCPPIALPISRTPALMSGLTMDQKRQTAMASTPQRFRCCNRRHDILLVQRLALPAQGIERPCTSTVRERGT